MARPEWERVTVVGCGLVGASFALALRRAGACARIAGWDSSDAVLDEALRRGVIDEIDQAFAAGEVSGSDLVYLATPVGGIVEFLRGRGQLVKSGAVVTDAGSTKKEICRAAREHLPEGRLFVGGHPVAGSRHSGLAHARADLFACSPYVLIEEAAGAEGFAALARTLRAFGANVITMSAEAHDRALAFVSHLPQLAASALAASVASQSDEGALLAVSGRGYADMTRLAASPWPMWRDILETNAARVADALEALIERLSAVRSELRDFESGGSRGLFEAERLFEEARSAVADGRNRSENGRKLVQS